MANCDLVIPLKKTSIDTYIMIDSVKNGTSATNVTMETTDVVVMTVQDFLERGKKALDAEPPSLSSWTTSAGGGVVGDAGLSDFVKAIELANCRPWTDVFHDLMDAVTNNKNDFVWKLDDTPCPEIYFEQGRAYLKLKRYEESLVAFHNALVMLEASVGRYHHSTGTAYLQMGLVYESMDGKNMYWMAKTKYQIALRIERNLYGEDGPWNVPQVISTLMIEKMGKSKAQVARKLDSVNTWIRLEVLGDEEADSNYKNPYYKAATDDERRTEGWNSNIALLYRKMVEPGKDVFDSFANPERFSHSCSIMKLGDASYLNGNYTGAIKHYKSAQVGCVAERRGLYIETLIWALLVMAIIKVFKRKFVLGYQWLYSLAETKMVGREALGGVSITRDAGWSFLSCTKNTVAVASDKNADSVAVQEEELFIDHGEECKGESKVGEQGNVNPDKTVEDEDKLMDSCCESLGAVIARTQEQEEADAKPTAAAESSMPLLPLSWRLQSSDTIDNDKEEDASSSDGIVVGTGEDDESSSPSSESRLRKFLTFSEKEN